jgi:hypothetical protein
MKTKSVQDALKQRYIHLHPVLFARSVEKAESDSELFDILETIPEYPLVWDENSRRWVTTNIFHIVFNSEENE